MKLNILEKSAIGLVAMAAMSSYFLASAASDSMNVERQASASNYTIDSAMVQASMAKVSDRNDGARDMQYD